MHDRSSDSVNAGPSFRITGTAPTADEAAAIAAAVERFAADTAPAASTAPRVNPWQQAALIEGVAAKRRAFPTDPGSGFPLRAGF